MKKSAKSIVIFIFLVILGFGLYYYYSRYTTLERDRVKDLKLPSEVATTPDAYIGRIKLASWNIRVFSDKQRNDNELRRICQRLIDYDFIALLEVKDEQILKRTKAMLETMGRNFDYQISNEVGRQVKERYAFLYDKAKIKVVVSGQVFPDNRDYFIREPFFATFFSGKFDFTVIVTHIIYGDKVSERRAEIQHLAEVYDTIKQANPEEKDIILVGDFNREPTDDVAFSNLRSIPSMTNLFNLPQKSVIFDSNLYDNIWFQSNNVKSYTGINGIDKFDETDFANNDKAASLVVSDHRPVWAIFDTKLDGD
jgi:endonuclease/exonuclease/phosphatase family metal-dependent hydrolase